MALHHSSEFHQALGLEERHICKHGVVEICTSDLTNIASVMYCLLISVDATYEYCEWQSLMARGQEILFGTMFANR